MTCLRCGAPLPVDATICGRCGRIRDSVGERSPDSRYADAPPPYGSPPGQQPYRHQANGPPQPPHPPSYAALPYPPSYAAPPYPPPGGGPAPYGVPGAWGPGGPPPPMRPPRAPLREGVVRAARLTQGIAALACLGHGLMSMTLRRAAYVDVGRGRGGSQSSDQLNGVLLTIASLSSLLALVLALVVLARRRGRVATSGTGLALFGLGWLVVLVGAALVAGADTRPEADTAAFAAVLVGVGFVVVAVGHALLASGLSAPGRDGSLATTPYPGPDPYAGTPLARDPADRPGAGMFEAGLGTT